MTNSWDVYPMKVIRDSVPPTLFDEVSGLTRVEVCQADHNLLASLPMMEVGGREGRDKNSEVHPTAAHRSALSVAASHPSQLVEIYTRLTVYSSLDPRSTLRHFKRGTDLTTPPPSLRFQAHSNQSSTTPSLTLLVSLPIIRSNDLLRGGPASWGGFETTFRGVESGSGE
jgi:hypothetical protein